MKTERSQVKYPPRWFVRASERIRYFFFRMNRRFTHPRVVLWEHVHNMWLAAGIGLAAELGIAEILRQGPVDVDELARKTGSEAASLYRVLRMLASMGIFRELRDRRFANTPLSRPLMEDGIRYLFRAHLSPGHFEMFGRLGESVESGKPVRGNETGRELFEQIAGDEVRSQRFNRAMSDISRMQVPALLPAFPFHRYATIADIGGGQGYLLRAILAASPDSRGILFDLPGIPALETDPDLGAGPEERISRVSGDFFEGIPGGADLYILKNVLHDWEDVDALKILANARSAMKKNTRLLVIEAVLEADNRPSFGKMTDVLMMVSAGGLERTRHQWEELFNNSGLKVCKYHPTVSPHCIIELRPV